MRRPARWISASVGWPPFAVLSVDGGNGYWHSRTSGEDAGAMVRNKLLPALNSQDLDTVGWRWSIPRRGSGALLQASRAGLSRERGTDRAAGAAARSVTVTYKRGHRPVLFTLSLPLPSSDPSGTDPGSPQEAKIGSRASWGRR